MDCFNHPGTVGKVPPLVTTPFVTQDQGNSFSLRHISLVYYYPYFFLFVSLFYSVPTLPDLMKQTAVPFGLVISPFAKLEKGEMVPPVVDMGQTGPVRCIRCKAYMCPFMQFIDGGRRYVLK